MTANLTVSIPTKKGSCLMEEQQIHNFVQRISTDETLRQQFTNNPDEVIARERFTPAVARVVARMVPQLTLHKEGSTSDISFRWWA